MPAFVLWVASFTRGSKIISALSEWESFYVIVGSSAGALTGLQFVVIALIADSAIRTTSAQIGAFGTPTIVHFSAVLIMSAVLSAPWPSVTGPAILLGTGGAIGLIYVGIVTTRATRQTAYKPVLEDWVWHTVLPLIAYALLLAGGILMSGGALHPFFMIAAASLILLLAGIHNAWDTVTFIVIERKSKKKGPVEAASTGDQES